MVEIAHRKDVAAHKWLTFLQIVAFMGSFYACENRRFSQVLSLRILIKEDTINATV
jgi:hypothetical protein